MAQVTKENFAASLPEILSAITECDFAAFDFEMTGIVTHQDTSTSRSEVRTVAEQYQHYRDAARSYLPIQLGLCTLTWAGPSLQEENLETMEGDKVQIEDTAKVEEEDDAIKEVDLEEGEDGETGRYIARCWNLFLFPPTNESLGVPSAAFACQSSSLQFLAKHNFDFNKWISEGIPYITKEIEDQAMSKVSARELAANRKPPANLDENAKEFQQNVIKDIRDWLQNSTEPVLEVGTPSSFHRFLVHNAVQEHFNDFLGTVSKSNFVHVSRETVEQKESRLREKNDGRYAELEALIGARRIIDHIISTKTPIIGHNSILDCMFLYQHFIGTLPETVGEYKKAWTTNFPMTVDTKYLTMTHPSLTSRFGGTILGDLHSTIRNYPEQFAYYDIQFDPAFQRYASATSSLTDSTPPPAFYHEAGYDAYVTAYVFVHSVGYARKNGNRIQMSTVPCANRHRMWRNVSNYFDLYEDEEWVDHSKSLFAYDFPSGVRTSDLTAYFQQRLGNFVVRWISNTSAFLDVEDEATFQDAVNYYESAGPVDGQFQVLSYSRFVDWKKTGKPMDEFLQEVLVQDDKKRSVIEEQSPKSTVKKPKNH